MLEYNPYVILLLCGLAVAVGLLVWWEEREMTRQRDRWLGRRK